jgi:hypothetical protein
MTEKKIQYIWGKAIESIVAWTVKFSDGSEQYYNPKQISYLVTEEIQDPTQIRDIILANILPEILSAIQSLPITDTPTEIVAKVLDLIEEHDIRRWDLAAIMDTVSYKFKLILDTVLKSYQELFSQAIWKAFWTYQEWRPSDYFFEDIKVSDIKKLIE